MNPCSKIAASALSPPSDLAAMSDSLIFNVYLQTEMHKFELLNFR